jgi:nitroreductase
VEKRREGPLKASEAIKKRISVRKYSENPVGPEERAELEEYSKKNTKGPFGTQVRFQLLNFDPLGREEMRHLGTYGVIRGAELYLLGAVKEGAGAFEDLGYCMEKIILKATAMGLGTCWLGGTFKRAAFAATLNLAEDELLPAITPIGYAADDSSLSDRMMRFGAASNKRKPWSELFFSTDGNIPLEEKDAAAYREVLEAVRIGPSASNRQPWRLVRDDSGRYHLFLKENKIYNRILGKMRMQNIDMGIAMSHFELVAAENQLPGRWLKEEEGPVVSGLQYIASWR